MKLAAVAFCLCLIAGAVWLGLTLTTSTESGETVESCVAEPIEEADASFCSNLEVTYVEVGNVTCKIIPQCNHFRQKITAWPPPQVKFREAESDKSYVLVMVDPDAPSRNEPTMKYWRHWVVSDIIGANIKNGLPRGNVLTAYEPPTPPPTTGLHRYQFRLYRQGDKQVSISSNENKNRGKAFWTFTPKQE
nr:phosphatidylethanolamine-binding protein 4-like [Meriones unguiculatus]